jgi:hypothetical protein
MSNSGSLAPRRTELSQTRTKFSPRRGSAQQPGDLEPVEAVGEPSVDVVSDGFEEIEGHRVSTSHVEAESAHCEARVESNGGGAMRDAAIRSEVQPGRTADTRLRPGRAIAGA